MTTITYQSYAFPGRTVKNSRGVANAFREKVSYVINHLHFTDIDVPSDRLEARSKKPTAGLVTALHRKGRYYEVHYCFKYTTHPTRPFPTPLKKPRAPSDSAPSIGFIYYQVDLRRRLGMTRSKTHNYAFHTASNTTRKCFSAGSDAITGKVYWSAKVTG